MKTHSSAMKTKSLLLSGLLTVAVAGVEAAQVRYAIVVHSEQPGGGGTSGVPVTPNFNATGPTAKATYVQWREAILSFAGMCATRNLAWQFQTDLNFAEGVARYEVTGGANYDASIANGSYVINATTDEKSTNTGGVNVVKYLHDHYGVNLDPHSHESSSIAPYNYADVAYQLDVKLNTDITGVVGGHVYDPTSVGYQDWPKFIEDRDGNGVNDGLACQKFASVAPTYRWKPVMLMGAGSLAHSADLSMSGLWRPQDANHFTTHSAAGAIAAIGNWGQDLHEQDRFLRLVENGTLLDATNKLWTLGRVLNHRDMLQTGYLSTTAAPILDTIKRWRDAGRFQVKTLQATYDEWMSAPFSGTSSIYQRPSDNISFSLNWQDFAYPDKSIAELRTLLNHHESLRVPVDVFFTTWQTDLIESMAPELLGRMQSSAWVSMAYHVRPPKPYASDYDWFTSTYGRSMTSSDIQNYEQHGLDLTTGEPTGASGGFAKLTSLMGYAPRVVGASSTGSVATTVHQYFAGAGASMLVEHSDNAINLGDMLDGMYLRPESYDWKLIETYRGDAGYVSTIDEAFSRAHSSTGNKTPWFVGVKLHDNDLFSEQSAWTYVYQPLARPRPWDPTAKPAALADSTRNSRRSYYLNLVSDAASRQATMNVVNVRDTLSLLAEEDPRPIGLSFTEVAEARPMGTVLAEINGGGVQSGVKCDYSLVSGSGADDNADFAIGSSNLVAARVLDYETKPVRHFRLRWTDGGGNTGERAMTLVLSNATTDDDDGDGFTEAEETLAGTDPRDASSRMAVTSTQFTSSQITLVWASVIGKQYRVQSSDDLLNWSDISGTLVTATTSSTSRTFSASSGERQFYRLAIVP